MTTAVIVTHALTQFSAAPVALALLREQIQATPTFIPLIAAGTNPFANLATSLLDIGDTFKAPPRRSRLPDRGRRASPP